MEHKFTNKLINETSPYLLQHAHNPVDWHAWNDEALSKAKSENKLLVISIGYAACHWCHVMEHESFEDTIVANMMNEFYVSIKVDREERPDVDQVYMDAAYLITGRGGWPLNIIALPDGRPVYAGTYFRKDDWLKVLNYFKDLYISEPGKFEQEAAKLTDAIKSIRIPGIDNEDTLFTKDELNSAFNGLMNNIDYNEGGTKGAPKFPMPDIYKSLLTFYYHTNNKEALDAVTITLNKMALGGIYDQLGGGFARYSTDDKWIVPHFEKMLYDNGQLVSLYSYAFKVTGNKLYKKVVYETLDFVERELTDNSGDFYSSLDADSEREEGKFYVWEKEEIDKLLGSDAELFCDYYSVDEGGNWEGKNVLFISEEKNVFFEKYGMNEKEFDTKIAEMKSILFKERVKRVRPGLDDKILTSWNALMLAGYIDAYSAFGEKKFLEAALTNGNFILKNLMKEDGRLYRNFKLGKSSINAFLDDYAYTIEAFIKLYEATFDETWLYKAKLLADYALQHFSDSESGFFFFTSNEDDPLIARKIDFSDNVTPSSNSSLAAGLFKLSKYFYSEDYESVVKKLVLAMKESMFKNPAFHANWLIQVSNFIYPYFEVAVVGDGFELFRKEISQSYLPNISVLGGGKNISLELLNNKYVNGTTIIYVCEDKVCQLPVEEVARAIEQITAK
ncbi:MAG: thioredoxin domain-containing protein [Ignavibacteriae bacterium]|nr:MAG: thioredoxin domain-containing protein [Ignavibacteriota bacterium]